MNLVTEMAKILRIEQIANVNLMYAYAMHIAFPYVQWFLAKADADSGKIIMQVSRLLM